MDKIKASEELDRFATMISGVMTVAKELRSIGSLEQAEKEAKDQIEAARAELADVKGDLEKLKAQQKAAKKSAAETQAEIDAKQAEQQAAFEKFCDDLRAQTALLESEHAARIGAFNTELQQRKDRAAGDVQAVIESKTTELNEVQSRIDELNKAAADAEERYAKAEKALKKLGLKLED